LTVSCRHPTITLGAGCAGSAVIDGTSVATVKYKKKRQIRKSENFLITTLL